MTSGQTSSRMTSSLARCLRQLARSTTTSLWGLTLEVRDLRRKPMVARPEKDVFLFALEGCGGYIGFGGRLSFLCCTRLFGMVHGCGRPSALGYCWPLALTNVLVLSSPASS